MDHAKHGEKLYMQAFREIRQYIIDQDLQPGELLPTEQQLCQKLGVSRNVLREAIKSMEVMGMIKACPGRGTELMEPNLEFLLQNVIFFSERDIARQREELAELQKTLELSFMRQAFQAIAPQDVARLRGCVDAVRAAENEEAAFPHHHAFRAILFGGLDNRVLRDLMNAADGVLSYRCAAGELLPAQLPGPERLDAIVHALEDYNYQAFAQAMVAYFSSGMYEKQKTSYYEH